jgi:hypothetical protein
LEPTKITLCPACAAYPEIAITDQAVTIGEDENTVWLSHAKWDELVRLAKAVELRQEAALIAACKEVIALVQRADTHIYSSAKIDRLTDRIAQLVDQIVSMRATTLAGFKARARALSTIYPSIVGDGEAVGDSAMVAALVRDLIAAI